MLDALLVALLWVTLVTAAVEGVACLRDKKSRGAIFCVVAFFFATLALLVVVP